jgi:hypothetical protein
MPQGAQDEHVGSTDVHQTVATSGSSGLNHQLVKSDKLSQSFLSFAATQCVGYSPLYERLSLGIAQDDSLLELVRSAPPSQQRPTLLFAAVHELLVQERQHPLAKYYPSVTSQVASGDPLAAFHSFCSVYRERILSRMNTGGTQTNDVRRSAALAIGLHHVQTRVSKPLVLVELGASVGLLLLFDRYRITIGGRVLGSEASPVDVSVDADESAEALAPPRMPSVADRVGVDLAPVDLSDDDQVRWLEAFVWPEAHGDRERLRAAIAIAQRHPPRVLQGDAVTILATVLDSISKAYVPVVFHSTLFTYLDGVQRQSIAQCVEAVGSRRDVCWLPLEAPGFLTRVDPAFQIPSAVATQNSQFVLAARWWRNAVPQSSVLAQVDAYGRSVRGLYHPERVAGSG